MSAASWGLVVPTQGSPIVPYRTPFITLAESVATALDKLEDQSFIRVATRSALPGSGNITRQHATVYADPTVGNNGDYYWNGSTWVQVGIFGDAMGVATYSGNIAAGAFGSPINISFPSGRFSQPPVFNATPSNSRVSVAYSNKTKDGIRIELGNWSNGTANGPFTIDWRASQATSASANG